MQVRVTPKRWGSSIAVIIPKEIVERARLKENVPIMINVNKERPKAGVLFGFIKDWKKATQEIKDEARSGWESSSDREREKKWRK